MQADTAGALQNLKSLARGLTNENNDQEIPAHQTRVITANSAPDFGTFLRTRYAGLAEQTAILGHTRDAAAHEAVPAYYGLGATEAGIDAVRETSKLMETGGACD